MFRREINVLDKCGTNILRSKGFTLLEIMFATLLLGLVVAAVWDVLWITRKAFEKGHQNSELYQQARICLADLTSDLRRSISPELYWNNMIPTPTIDPNTPLPDEELEPIPTPEDYIIFEGTDSSVTFTVSRKVPRGHIPYDFRLVTYEIVTQGDKKGLYKKEGKGTSITNSVLYEHWKYLVEQAAATPGKITDFVVPELTIEMKNKDFWEQVEEAHFEYLDSDTDEWVTYWNSRNVLTIGPLTPPASEETPLSTVSKKKGLPKSVKVVIRLINGDILETKTEIPSFGLNQSPTPPVL